MIPALRVLCCPHRGAHPPARGDESRGRATRLANARGLGSGPDDPTRGSVVRGRPPRLERGDRPLARGDPGLRARSRRSGGRALRGGRGPPRDRARGRPQPRRPIPRRRRPVARSVRVARRTGRPARTSRPRRRGRHLARGRRGQLPLRARNPGRHGVFHRCRRPHAGRRDRLAHAAPRAHGGQLVVRGRRSRRRQASDCERHGERAALLGTARGRRTARRRHALRVRVAPGLPP